MTDQQSTTHPAPTPQGWQFDIRSVTAWIIIVLGVIELLTLALNGLGLFPQIDALYGGFRNYVRYSFGLFTGAPFLNYVTHAMIHANILHAFFNLQATSAIAPYVESQMGKLRFFLFTIAAAITAGSLTLMTHNLSERPVLLIGFSGVVFAYLGVQARDGLTMARAQGRSFEYLKKLILNPIILIFVFLPIILPIGISGLAHLYGLIFGVVFGRLFYKPNPNRVIYD